MVRVALIALAGMISALPALGQGSERAGPSGRSASSCRSPPAAVRTPSPASSGRSSANGSASSSWSRTASAAAAPSAPNWSRAPSPTAMCSASPIPARTRSRRAPATSRTIRSRISRRSPCSANSPFLLALYPGLPVRSVQDLIALAKSKPHALNYASAGPATLGASLRRAVREDGAHRADARALSRHRAVDRRPDGGPRRDAVRHHSADIGACAGRQAARARRHRRGRATRRCRTCRRSRSRACRATSRRCGRRSSRPPRRRRRSSRASTAKWPPCSSDPDVRAAFAKHGVDALPGSPDALAARIRDDVKKWRDVITAAGIRAQ